MINDTAKQQQNVDDLSRDVEHAHQTLSPIFDKEKEQQRMQTLQLIGEVGNQAADIARTQGQIEATKAANEKMKDVSPEQLKTAESDWRKGNPGKEPTTNDIRGQAYQNFYNKAFTESGFGTGGKVQQAIQAATAAVQGLAGGDIVKAIAGGSAPYIAGVIDSSGLDDSGKVLAHAAVNAALAAAQGNNALVGAAGATTAEMVGMIALNAYGKPVSELSETEKQTVSALATLAAGLAGGLTGNSTADTVAAAQAGKTTVENNLMGGTEDGQEKFAREHGKNIASCADNPGSASCQKGLAMQDALMVALPAGLGGGILAAATPEIAAAAKAAIQGCAGNVVLCLNNAGIQVSEAIVPGGVGVGGAIGIGKTAAEATAAKAEVVAANSVKNTSSWKAGEYLDDFKVSSTPLELVKEQAGKGPQTAYIRMDHILNGEVKTLKDGTKVGSGGHYIRDPNIKVEKITGAPDVNGVSTGYISVRDPATGQWVNKKAQTTFFPEHWSKRQTAQEIESAFKGSAPDPLDRNKWQGISSSGIKIEGYYGKPDGNGATAWPVYHGKK